MYPNSIDTFTDKLDKRSSNYVIEEKLPITAGQYDGPLAHDNINNDTVQVYSGSRLTGVKLTNWVLSTPDAMPWRRSIKIFASGYAEVFVSYETPGDTVEADDINAVQAAITATQTELDRFKSRGLIDGGNFSREV
ncbi:phosphoglucomutase [Gorillibacterium sp. sgz500922]|uniref:phosphoglucomutase n=1 Tax=Gorillibacterium sp. sgz500922 TaxID=3446694 RepID=UPI003F66352C